MLTTTQPSCGKILSEKDRLNLNWNLISMSSNPSIIFDISPINLDTFLRDSIYTIPANIDKTTKILEA